MPWPGSPVLVGDIIQASQLNLLPIQIADSTLSGSASSFDFISLPGQFSHLMVVLYARADIVATTTAVAIRFNNDSTNNYHGQSGSFTSTTVTATDDGASAISDGFLGVIPGASAPSNSFGVVQSVIGHYTNATNYKLWTSQSTAHIGATGSGSETLRVGGGVWLGTPAAISRVTLIAAGGNFVAGSRATIYGLA